MPRDFGLTTMTVDRGDLGLGSDGADRSDWAWFGGGKIGPTTEREAGVSTGNGDLDAQADCGCGRAGGIILPGYRSSLEVLLCRCVLWYAADLSSVNGALLTTQAHYAVLVVTT